MFGRNYHCVGFCGVNRQFVCFAPFTFIYSCSLFILSITLEKVGSLSNKQVSSANNLGTQLTEFGRSLMCNKKSKGPILDP